MQVFVNCYQLTTATMLMLASNDVLAREVTRVIQTGEIAELKRLLSGNPQLAAARIAGRKGSRSLLHVVADWPGFFPNGPAVVTTLIAAGADPNAPAQGGSHSETPLHWAASSDDVEVAAALIAGGANIEATGASIAGGTPLDDAIGYGCWGVARLLLERGAKVEKLWHAAGLGLTSKVAEFFAASPPPSQTDVNDAFWQASHGGHRRTAEYLLARGADVNWIPDYAQQPPVEIAAAISTGRQALVTFLRDHGAKPSADALQST